MRKRQTWLSKFLAAPSNYPLVLALATGLYPIFFYYTNNYSLINTSRHLIFFVGLFFGVPLFVFLTSKLFFKSKSVQLRARIPTFFNVLFFLIFIELCLYAKIQIGFTLIILLVALVVTYFFSRFLGRIALFQLLLAGVALFFALPVVYGQLNYSESWMEQPDDIEGVRFQKRPNIYFIQPDGYVNFSEINKGYYQFDNSEFASFLTDKSYALYPDARSNYGTTLTSNSSIFSMKHHYYNNGFNFKERMNAREVIISDNAVLRVLKNNNYKTHYLAEWAYLLINRPEMGYDACNFSYDEVPILSKGFDEIREVEPSLSKFIDLDQERSKFFFIELFLPGHIATKTIESTGKEGEKEWWLTNLKTANEKLKTLLSLIEAKDPEALVVIMSDHGGYVGMDYMQELRIKTQDRDKLYSGFSSILAVKWPNNDAPKFDKRLKTGVNLFRILFAYLGEEESYLEHLQDDGSYHHVDRNAPKGIYQYIDSEGEVVFIKQN